MKAKHIDLSHLLPKTGQIVSYQAGDDGHYEAGWWKGLLNTDNKTRFIPKTLNGDDVVIDLATGLMFAADGSAAGCGNGGPNKWADWLIYTEALNFAGFTDWRVPNTIELLSLVNLDESSPVLDKTVFPNTLSQNYWTSSTYRLTPIYAWYVNFAQGHLYNDPKTNAYWLRCVRGGL